MRYLKTASIFLVLIFLPAFIFPFSAHTDGFYIVTLKGNWLGNNEAPALIMQGRPFFAWLNSFLGWHISSIEQFTYLRIFIFLTKMAASWLVFKFCTSLSMSYLCSFATAFFFILLPANILNVLWTSNGMPESIALLFGLTSYVMLTTTLLKKKNAILAAALFLCSLLTYQPMAMIVFAMMFLKMLFAQESWASTRASIIKECCFFGVLLAVYWAIVKIVILPYGKNVLKFPTLNSNIYDMELVHNFSKKYDLACELLRNSLIGTWDALLHNHPRIEWLAIAAFWIVAGTVLLIYKKRVTGISNIAIQKLACGVILFLLANTPSLMPVNYTSIIGYRTFLSSSLMGLALVIFYFNYLARSVDNRPSKKIVHAVVAIYFLSMTLTATWLIHQTVRNYRKENHFVQAIAAKTDYSRVDTVAIILNRRGDSVIEYELPFEFGLTTTTTDHIRFMFEKYSLPLGKTLTFQEVFLDWPVVADDHMQVVDMPSLRGVERIKYAKPGVRMKVHLSAEPQANISIINVSSTAHPLLVFKEIDTQTHKERFWTLKPGTRQEYIEVEFIDKPKLTAGYKLQAVCEDSKKNPCHFSWQIQTSNDHQQWQDLSFQTSRIPKPEIFELPSRETSRYIRFIITKDNPDDTLLIQAVQLFNF